MSVSTLSRNGADSASQLGSPRCEGVQNMHGCMDECMNIRVLILQMF